jgi:cytochrome c peroxidase
VRGDFSGELVSVFVQDQLTKANRILKGEVQLCTVWLVATMLFLVLTLSSAAFAQSYPPPSPLTPQDTLFYTNILNGQTPATIPQSLALPDGIGLVSSHQSTGNVTTSSNIFFQSLGSNGRTCLTCHQPENGWGLSPTTVQSIYLNTQGQDPLFAAVDGSDCPNLGAAAVQPGRQFLLARKQLFNRANIRISLPEPTVHDWYSVTVTSDPTGCELSPVYGLLATPTPMASFYRRPLPSANTAFINPAGACSKRTGVCKNNIMWDAREPSLESQFVDATTVHAQATSSELSALTAQVSAMGASFPGVSFQNGNFTAESWDLFGWDLTGSDGSGANGGPNALSALNPAGTFRPASANGEAFDVFDSFAAELPWTASMRASIVRGQNIFNNFPLNITGVRGMNDLLGQQTIAGSCRFCHNNLDVGNDFAADPKDIGVMDSTSNVMPPSPDLPVFTFVCPQGSLSSNGVTPYSNPVACSAGVCDQYQTTDPGQAWITGKCADLGKMKVPALRGQGSRPPFFHGGNANTMLDVVNFYNQRFNMGLTEQDILDLVNFLNAL